MRGPGIVTPTRQSALALARRTAAGRAGGAPRPGWRAAALLEVVLALALFFGVAVGILGGLSASVRAAREIRLDAQAADLAVTLLSEIQLGVVAVENDGPRPYEEPLENWTWQVAITPVTGTLTDLKLTRVEVVVRNLPENYTYRLYHLRTEREATASAPGEEL